MSVVTAGRYETAICSIRYCRVPVTPPRCRAWIGRSPNAGGGDDEQTAQAREQSFHRSDTRSLKRCGKLSDAPVGHRLGRFAGVFHRDTLCKKRREFTGQSVDLFARDRGDLNRHALRRQQKQRE